MTLIYKLWLNLTKPAELASWLGSGARTVPPREANRRAMICHFCPNNQTVSLAIGASAIAIKNRLGLKVLNEHWLGTCKGCGCYLPLKVWVPYEHIKAYSRQSESDDMRNANPNCWQI